MKEKDYAVYLDIINNTVIPSAATTEEQTKLMRPLLKWLDTHTPPKLYKFRECNENNINAFRNQQIWFATGAKMNDDYDAVLYCNREAILHELSNQFDENGMLKVFSFLQTGREAPAILYGIFGRQYIEETAEKIQSISEAELRRISSGIKAWAEEGFRTQFPFIAQSIQNVVKISSFSENINSPLMWGHYAKNSSGFALAYDFRHRHYNECPSCEKLGVTCTAPKLCTLMPIIYRNNRIDATEFARYLMQQSFTQNLCKEMKTRDEMSTKILSTVTCSDTFMQSKIIHSKYRDWDDEKEWRMTVSYNAPSCATDQTAYIWRKPCALYLGRNIKDTDELVLRNIAYTQRIPVYKMEIDETSTGYDLKPIKQRNTRKELVLK